MLAIDLQRWDAKAEPYEIAVAVVTEVHKGICRQLGESYQEKDSLLPNEERIEKILKLVSRHWTGPILVERTINETIKMVLEHWRDAISPNIRTSPTESAGNRVGASLLLVSHNPIRCHNERRLALTVIYRALSYAD